MIGKIISHYKVLEKLGEGGMGVVYKAEDTKLKRTVALKFLPPKLTIDPDAKRRFILEAQATSALQHNNICTIHEIDETDDGQLFICIDYYEGETLKKKIEQGPLKIEDVVDIAIQIAQGLVHAHEEKEIHRDIKPANIMITNRGVIKIVDFGLAKLAKQAKLTTTKTMLGTITYISPEQASGEMVDHRTDIWSLGVTLYEMSTSQTPFKEEYEAALFYSIMNESPVPPKEIREDIPVELEKIILKCLRKNREHRYSSASQLLKDLKKFKKTIGKVKHEPIAYPKEKPEIKKETEHRQATVMFVEIAGYNDMLESMDTEEAALIMKNCFGMFDSIAQKYKGNIHKIIGNTLTILFGIPQAVENAPKETINTAIEMRNQLYQFNQNMNLSIPLDIHIGINTGTVIAGAIGTDEESDYVIMGDTITLASQLKDLSSKGEIFVGPATYYYTKIDFDYKPLKPITIECKTNTVNIYKLLSTKTKIYRPELYSDRMIYSEMVGRDNEYDKLKLHVLKVINGEGSIVSVIGEAGIGKSRLIAELSKKEEIKRTTFLKGRALSMGRNLSFHPIIEIIKTWAKIKEDDKQIELTQKVERSIKSVYPDGVSEVFPFIATMMGIKLSGKHAERIKGIEGEALKKLILKNLREFIIKASEVNPIVFILEDLHWADISSIELFESLYRIAENHSILFINVLRPNYPETGERILETIRERYNQVHSEIFLEPLGEKHSETLIQNLLKVSSLPQKIKITINDRTEGNPFFIEEVIRSFIDEGVVEFQDGKFEITERIDLVVIPETINEVLMSRIDKFDENTRSLLKIASVIGRNFFYKILVEVAKTVEEINERLVFLKEVQLIKEQIRMEEIEYLFKHAVAHEAVYNSILQKKKKELHLNVARSIESVFQDKLHEFYGMLAYHYSYGENLKKAEEYLVKAGEEALKASASSEALYYYQEALKLYLKKHGDFGDPNTIASLEWNIAKAFLNKGHMTEAVTHFDRVLELWGERIPKNKIINTLCFIANLFQILIFLYLPSRKAKLSPSKRDNNIFEVVYQRGTALVSVDTHRMVMDSIRILKTCQKHDLYKIHNGVPMYSSSSALFFFSGISFKIARKLLNYARQHINPSDKNIMLTYNFWKLAFNTLSGNWDERIQYDSEIIDQNIQRGELYTGPGFLFYSGLMVTEQGDFSKAQIFIDKLFEIEEIYENIYIRVRRYVLKTRQLLKTRKLLESLKVTDVAIPQLIKFQQKFFALHLIGMKANSQILLGDFSDAENSLTEARELISNDKRIAPFYISTFRISQFLFDICMLEEISHSGDKTKFNQYRKKTHQSGNEAVKNSMKCALDKTETFKLMGVYHWLCGKQKKALVWWGKSIKTGEKLKAKTELGRTYLEVGKRLLENKSRIHRFNGVEPLEYLEKSKAIFENMGLNHDLEEFEKFKK